MFAKEFGFPGFYGRNMNAWIDCMSYLDDSSAKVTTLRLAAGQVVALELEFVDEFAKACPELFAAVVDCSAFVNWRRIELGHPPLLALSFNKRVT